jgi:hypothetical protein
MTKKVATLAINTTLTIKIKTMLYATAEFKVLKTYLGGGIANETSCKIGTVPACKA